MAQTDRYQILQWTPHSAHYHPEAPYQPMAEWQLQTAEHALQLNKIHYYEHASGTGNTIFYPADIAQRIAAYWQMKWPWAEYQLKKG
jgi:hypothetical protein